MDQGEAEILTDRLAQVPLRRGVRQRRQKLPIRKLGQAITLAMHAQQPLQAAVIGRQVLVFDRPAGAVPIAGSRLELVVGEPQGDPSPGEAAATHLPATAPDKGPRFGVV